MLNLHFLSNLKNMQNLKANITPYFRRRFPIFDPHLMISITTLLFKISEIQLMHKKESCMADCWIIFHIKHWLNDDELNYKKPAAWISKHMFRCYLRCIYGESLLQVTRHRVRDTDRVYIFCASIAFLNSLADMYPSLFVSNS